DDGRPVRQDLAHDLAHLGGVEPEGEDRVRPEALGMLAEPLDGLGPDLLQKLGVLLDLAPREAPEAGGDVPPQPSGAHDQAERQPDDLRHPVPGTNGVVTAMHSVGGAYSGRFDEPSGGPDMAA